MSVLALGGCDTAAPPVDDDDDENGAPVTPDPDPDPDPGEKTLRVGLNVPPRTMDPHDHRHRISQSIARNWTDGLRQQVPSGQQMWDLATGKTIVDEQTWDLHLRQDVTFHNGDPMTADDVVFSLRRLAYEGGLEGETSPRRPLMGPMEQVEKIDDYTVRIIWSEPVTPALVNARLFNGEILPKNYYEEVGYEAFLENPVGVGPFRVVEIDLPNQVVMERYEDYYGGHPDIPGDVDRVPAVDRVIFRFIEEESTRISALLAGDVDIINVVGFDSVSLLEANPNTRVATSPGTSVVMMQFNVNLPPFDNKLVRQAAGYAIDYDLISEALYHGFTETLYGRPWIEPHPGETGSGEFQDIQGYYYSPDKAKALLEESGVENLDFILDTTQMRAEEAQALSQMLNDVGFNSSVRIWEGGTLTEAVSQGDRQANLWGFGNATRVPWHFRVKLEPDGPTNETFWSDPTIFEMLEEAMIMPDSPERINLIEEAFEIWIEEAPIIFIHCPNLVEGTRANVKNFYPSATGRYNMHRVDIE